MDYKKLLCVLAFIALSACKTLEHRSEKISKTPLSPLTQNLVNPKLLWSNTNSSSLAKSDLHLLLAHQDAWLINANAQGNMVALNKENGQKKWSKKLKQGISAGPYVAENVILLGLNTSELMALNLNDGSVLWTTPLNSEILASPIISNGLVYIHTLEGSIRCLNLMDGRELWRYSLNNASIFLRKTSKPLWVQDKIIAGLANGKVVALNPQDGNVIWEREVATAHGFSDMQRMVDLSADPVSLDNKIYIVGLQGPCMALEADTGSLLWQNQAIHSLSGLSVNQKNVFVSDVQGNVWFLLRKDGNLVWKNEALKGRLLSKPIYYNHYIIVGDDEGFLHWFNEADGALVGRLKVDNKAIKAEPVIINNILYVLTSGGSLKAYAL
ncbi:MAG: Outer rane assembly lipoprotein YfgL [Francisellaceae bacterium]|nr:Outer rane assembly lipoprotein YfgL [Francisellaceae bacterium]